MFLKFLDIIIFRDVFKDIGFQVCYYGNIYNDFSQDLYLFNGLKFYNYVFLYMYIYYNFIL